MFEYKVIPAPAKGRKARGVKGAEARFAFALEHVMNEWAADGWEFQRADILPSEERQGLTSTQTVYRSVLIFRRPVDTEAMDDIDQDLHEDDGSFEDNTSDETDEETPPEAASEDTEPHSEEEQSDVERA